MKRLFSGDKLYIEDQLNGSIRLGPLPPRVRVGGLQLVFSIPNVVVTFSGSAGSELALPVVVSEINAVLPGLASLRSGSQHYIVLTNIAELRVEGSGAGAVLGVGPGIYSPGLNTGFISLSAFSSYLIALTEDKDVVMTNALIVDSGSVLTTLNDTVLSDGQQAHIRSIRDEADLIKNSTATVDNITVWATQSGTGRWIRRLNTHQIWAQQDDWYIDPVGGDDENVGDVSSPLQTFSELTRRLGKKHHIINNTGGSRELTIHLLGDIAEDVDWDISQDRNARLIVKGLLSDPITTALVAAKTTPSGNTPGALTAETSPGVNWSPAAEIGRVVKSGTSYCYPALDNGGGQARISEWGAETQNSPFSMSAGSEPSIGATVTTHSWIARIQNINLRTAGAPSARQIVFEDVEFYGWCFLSNGGGQTILNRCKLDSSVTKFLGGTVGLTNCLVNRNLSAVLGNDIPGYSYYNGGLVRGATQTSGSTARQSELILTSGVLFQSVGINYRFAHLRVQTARNGAGARFCDIATAITIRAQSTLRTSAPLCGTGVTGFGVKMEASDLLVEQGVTNLLAGGSGDFCFSDGSVDQASAWAFDDAVGQIVTTGGKRTLSWTNLSTAVASGGFGDGVVDLKTGCRARMTTG